MKKLLFIALVAIIFFASCDSNHAGEFNKIDRYDISGYEEFIMKYPESNLVDDARERIEVAKEEIRLEEERKREREIVRRYENNSLQNGAQPYSQWYGCNAYYDDYTAHSEIRVTAPDNSDVIVIVRYNNHNGKVAGHKYIKAGYSSSIHLANGYNYQTFFYYGNGWNPEKVMKNGLRGGFVKDESYSKDGSSSYLDNNILTYELVVQYDGNFSTSRSDEGEIF